MQRYPFLEAYSKPIRCISRNRTIRPLGPGKRVSSATADETDLLNSGQGFASADKVNGREHSHGHSSAVSLHASMLSNIEGGMVKVVEAQKIVSQVMN